MSTETAHRVAPKEDRLAELRASLPLQGQVLSKIEEVQLRYGKLYSQQELDRKIASTLPPMPFRVRKTRWYVITQYPNRIPDAALLKYGEALDSGLFSTFSVGEPYYEKRPVEVDPWIVGYVSGTSHLFAVIASWA